MVLLVLIVDVWGQQGGALGIREVKTSGTSCTGSSAVARSQRVRSSVTAMGTLVATLFVEVRDHCGDSQPQADCLEGIHGVSIEQEGEHQRQDLAAETDQRTVQGTELGDRHENKHLSKGTRQAKNDQRESSLFDGVQKLIQSIRGHQHTERDNCLAKLNVVHEIKWFDVVLTHQLVLVCPSGTVETQRDREHDGAQQKRVRFGVISFFVRGAAAAHEETHTGSDNNNVDVLHQFVTFAQN
mmetsp:Transcript_13590/g.23857  ORF Transcript_13590/g.23857 Transcript_13590/m.23857 type:complete len:241 (+) Transcript_13590:334-1056(+)